LIFLCLKEISSSPPNLFLEKNHVKSGGLENPATIDIRFK
jgi:hypothetical protein